MTVAEKVTWMTHYPGLQKKHLEMCGAELSFVANNQKQSQVITIPSTSYSCEYRVSVPTLTYRNTAKILMWLEQASSVSIYLYSGTDRTNLTALIEGNSTPAVGAPFSINLDDGLVIIAHVVYKAANGSTPDSSNGTFQFGYKVEGEKYPWWEQLLLGKQPRVSVLIISLFTIAGIIALCFPCYCVGFIGF